MALGLTAQLLPGGPAKSDAVEHLGHISKMMLPYFLESGNVTPYSVKVWSKGLGSHAAFKQGSKLVDAIPQAFQSIGNEGESWLTQPKLKSVQVSSFCL